MHLAKGIVVNFRQGSFGKSTASLSKLLYFQLSQAHGNYKEIVPDYDKQ